jgi:predicted DsbA family dithiol-disulfide isomerase
VLVQCSTLGQYKNQKERPPNPETLKGSSGPKPQQVSIDSKRTSVPESSCAIPRLVELAHANGKGPEAKDVLFEKTYELGLNVSSLDVLIEAGQELDILGVEDYLVRRLVRF